MIKLMTIWLAWQCYMMIIESVKSKTTITKWKVWNHFLTIIALLILVIQYKNIHIVSII